MRRIPTLASALLRIAPLLVFASCGGGDGGTDPIVVTSVVITAPAAPPSLRTLGRTVQFTANARDATNATIATAAIGWSSTNATAATVNASSGLVTAVANGTTTITASSSGVNSTGVLVTVAQAVDTVNPTPAAVAFGAIGSTRQLAATAIDSSDAPVASAPAVAWTRVGSGIVASVSPTGLATALAVGNSDTAIATIGTKSTRIPISVTQVVASVLVTPAAPETLRTTTRTKQYTASPRDSQANVMGTAVTWSSTLPSVATVDASTGLATAVSDGNTGIVATAAGIQGQRTLTVRRYANAFTMAPSAASITTSLGTQIFTGTAQDSINTNLPITWTTRNGVIVTVSPSGGVQTTARAVANGQTYVVMAASGSLLDSALVTVTGQVPLAPGTADVLVENFQFRSVRNGTFNSAVDTVSVSGQVTWTWNSGGTGHNVNTDGSPSFTSSTVRSGTSTYSFTFANAGTYQYICILHPSMTGRIVVR